MGKFFEALKKSEKSKRSTSPEKDSRKVVNISREEIDATRLDSRVLTEPTSQQEFTDEIDPRLICLQEPSSPAAECFKILRSKILVGKLGKNSRTFMVSSAEPFDGKSLVSANLAVSIARGINESVLLVDADLRRPSLHTTFGLNPEHGLREYLEEGVSIAPYLVKTPVQKLTLLPAGKPPSNPASLLSSNKMRKLIHELISDNKDHYIIIDSAPGQFTAESSCLASMADGVLLVVRAGKTPRERIMDFFNSVGQEKVLGIIFNADHDEAKSYKKFYNYYRSGAKR